MQICRIRGRSTQLGGLKDWRTIKDKGKGKIKKKGIGARCGTADENITQAGRKKEKLKLNMRKGRGEGRQREEIQYENTRRAVRYRGC